MLRALQFVCRLIYISQGMEKKMETTYTASWTKWDEIWAVRVVGQVPPSADGEPITVTVTKKSGETAEVTIWAAWEWEKDGVSVHHLSKELDSKGGRAWLRENDLISHNGRIYPRN